MNRYFLYIATAATLLTAACTKQPSEEEDPVIPVTGITLNPCDTVLLVGATLTLTAAVEPAGATNQTVTWNTSDDRVATVSPAGELTAVAPGTTTITAIANDGRFTTTCTVFVTESNITMTTQASEIIFWIYFTLSAGESKNFTIDWGNGKKSNLNDAAYLRESTYWDDIEVHFEHIYSDASEHRITITGENIRSLLCSKTQLTALDVSRYPELKGLNCGSNQLTVLDVSKNTALTSLYCFDNPLATLDVSRNTALMFLHCANTQITNLDVSRNTALMFLHCANTQITNLDVNRNTALSELICRGNQLTALDASQNTVLEYLDCRDNQLTASALNDLFETLPYVPGGYIGWEIAIWGNPGANDCDFSIAESKGWQWWKFGPRSMEAPIEL